jgi:hypothetical protein
MDHTPVQYRNLAQPVAGRATTFASAPSRPALLAALFAGAPAFASLQAMYDWCAAGDAPSELPPEFFFAPDAVSNIALPDWCSNDPDEFVYMHRKFLESDDVSAGLARWIDFVFGYATSPRFAVYAHALFGNDEAALRVSGQLPATLFAEAHPQRRFLLRVSPFHAGAVAALPQAPAAAVVLDVSGQGATFLIAVGDGEVLWVKIEFPDGRTVRPIEKVVGRLAIGRRRMFAVAKHAVATVCERGMRAVDVTGVRCAGGGDRLAILVDAAGQLWKWVISTNAVAPLCCITRDYVVCMAVSEAFGIAVVGTKDGGVIALLLADGAFLWSKTVSTAARRILVTEGWGFVFVEAGNVLYLFTVNGRLLRTVEIEFRIVCIATWKCERDFDFFGIADSEGAVRVFESFFMNVDEVLWEGKKRIIAISDSTATSAVIVITESGEIITLPRVLA